MTIELTPNSSMPCPSPFIKSYNYITVVILHFSYSEILKHKEFTQFIIFEDWFNGLNHPGQNPFYILRTAKNKQLKAHDNSNNSLFDLI